MKSLTNINKYVDVMGLGVEMAATMVLPILLGIYLDDTFGFEPWGVLLGVFFGLIGLMSRLYKLILMLKRESPPTKKLK
jgi:F0F1-type ATP synthase assembly protein I